MIRPQSLFLSPYYLDDLIHAGAQESFERAPGILRFGFAMHILLVIHENEISA